MATYIDASFAQVSVYFFSANLRGPPAANPTPAGTVDVRRPSRKPRDGRNAPLQERAARPATPVTKAGDQSPTLVHWPIVRSGSTPGASPSNPVTSATNTWWTAPQPFSGGNDLPVGVGRHAADCGERLYNLRGRIHFRELKVTPTVLHLGCKRR